MKRLIFALLTLFALHPPGIAAQQPTVAPPHLAKLAHTYSIVAFDSATGDLGVAVASAHVVGDLGDARGDPGLRTLVLGEGTTELAAGDRVSPKPDQQRQLRLVDLSARP